MKAVRQHEYGGTDVLRYEEAERPTPGSGQVLVRVAAMAFNPVDAAIRAGYLQDAFPLSFPHILGSDMAGTVVEVGDGVTGLHVDDAVLGFLPMNENGAAAQFALAPSDVLAAAPASIPLTDAAALPSSALTAHQALFEHADLRADQRLLVNGAGGAVGGYAVQLAKQAGATVIATASPRSVDTVRSYGPDQIVDHTSTSVTDAVTEPVDVVLDLVAAPASYRAALVDLVRPGGVLVTTVPADADPPDSDVRVITMFVRSDAEALAGLAAQVDAGRLRVNIGARHPLEELALVHEQSAAGQLSGKALLIPPG